MNYTEKQKTDIFESIIERIINGESVRNILKDKGMPSTKTFYDWLEKDEQKVKHYARATEIRADKIFEEIIEIADHSEEDHTPFTGTNVIQRDRLKIDARKWIASKLNPKKYGDKIQNEHSGDLTTTIISLGTGIKPAE